MDENHFGLDHLIAYREGALPAAEREAVQEHLSLCPSCTRLLLELRDFAADAAAGNTGPESLRREAWDSLVRRLPRESSTVRPISGAARPAAPPPRRRMRFLSAAAAALLLAVLGLSIWRQVGIEQELEERDAELAALQRSLDESEHQLIAAQRQLQALRERPAPAGPGQPDGRVDELEARIAELTSELEALRRVPKAPERPQEPAVASRQLEASVAPRFSLRGQDPAGGLLRGGGAVNPVRPPAPAGRLTMALSLTASQVYGEYRFELVDREGQVLWTARRPGGSVLGDAGTSVSVEGLGPGLYRLRIDGLLPGRSQRLAEYLLEVEAPEAP